MTAGEDGQLRLLRLRLAAQLQERRRMLWGWDDPQRAESLVERFWLGSVQQERVRRLGDLQILPPCRILDLGCGHGHFVFQALEEGYDCFGVEPDPWTLSFVRDKLAASGLPPSYGRRIVPGVGEHIPFADGSFDYVVSYQTMEHVQEPLAVLGEMIRVAKVGGGIHIVCPDYRSTWEGHYYLPWFPLFPKWAARVYLRALRRPEAGLASIQYVTTPRIVGWLRHHEQLTRCRLNIVDVNRLHFEKALAKRGCSHLGRTYALWRFWRWLSAVGRREVSVDLFVRILAK